MIRDIPQASLTLRDNENGVEKLRYPYEIKKKWLLNVSCTGLSFSSSREKTSITAENCADNTSE